MERTTHKIGCYVWGFQWVKNVRYNLVCSRCGVKYTVIRGKRKGRK